MDAGRDQSGKCRNGRLRRREVRFDFTQDDSITVLPNLPPGHYTVRAMATPGVKTWWNAAADTFVVGPGQRRDKIIPAKIRT